jgi:hypothetical protein
MVSTEVMRREEGRMDIIRGWTPSALREQVAREKDLRLVIIEYYQSCMVKGHHYYRINEHDESQKPALSKEGALNLCSLFKVRPEPDPPIETWMPDGHYRVRYRTRLVSIETGELVAIGDGLCSTRESRYAYRYASRICPQCGKSAIIKGREEYGGGWLCFKRKDGCGAKFDEGDPAIEAQITGRVANEDLADQENTVLKMSEKRSLVDGALKLPLASELFIQDLDEQIQLQQSQRESVNSITDGLKEPRRDVAENSMVPTQPRAKLSATDVSDLLKLLHEAYRDSKVVDQHIRTIMHIPPEQSYTSVRLRLTMTWAQYDQLKMDAETYIREAIAHEHHDTDEDDVLLDGERITDEVKVAMASPVEVATRQERENVLASTPLEEDVPVDETEGQPPTQGEAIYATAAELDALMAVAAGVGKDASAEVERLRAHHPKGVTREVLAIIETRLKGRAGTDRHPSAGANG